MTRRARQVQSAAVEQSAAASFAATRDELDQLAAVGAKFEAWKPASQVLVKVRAVPTCFVQVDEATRVGGWPIQRITLVHGPSNEGKTAFCMGLGLSFLRRGHFFNHIDAERSTPEPWARELLGSYYDSPLFKALRPHTYEEAADAVRQACTVLAEARAKGKLPPNTSMLFVVDSLRKLTPKNLLAKIMKEAADAEPTDKRKKPRGIDGAGGRAAQIKAAINSQWMDELVPLLEDADAGMVLVARETEDPDAGHFHEVEVQIKLI